MSTYTIQRSNCNKSTSKSFISKEKLTLKMLSNHRKTIDNIITICYNNYV